MTCDWTVCVPRVGAIGVGCKGPHVHVFARNYASLRGPAPGKRFTASQLDAAFELLLSCGAGLSDEEIKNYSVHSFRIFLACALLAAKCPRWLIMQMLRWRSEKSLDIYARVSDHEWSARLSSSLGVTVDASLVPRLPQIDLSEEQLSAFNSMAHSLLSENITADYA